MRFANDQDKLRDLANLMNEQSATPMMVTDDLLYVIDAALLPEEVEVRTHGREGYALAEDKGVVVAVDVALTPELAREGLARDLVRRIQTLRKDADFQLDDRIVTYLDAADELRAVVAVVNDQQL